MRSKRKASPVYNSKQSWSSPDRRRQTWRINYTVISDDDEDDNESNNAQEAEDEEWEIEGILDETESQYMIDWAGDYSPTWEPKDNASEVAIQVWEEKKTRKKSQLAPGTNKDPARTAPTQPLTPAPERRPVIPEQEHITGSSLFVSPEGAPGETPPEANNPPQSSVVIEESIQLQLDTKPNLSRRNHNVFEYYPWSPIPSRYLPGESQDRTRCPTPSSCVSDLTEGRSVQFEAALRQCPIARPRYRTEIPESPSGLLAPPQESQPVLDFQLPTSKASPTNSAQNTGDHSIHSHYSDPAVAVSTSTLSSTQPTASIPQPPGSTQTDKTVDFSPNIPPPRIPSEPVTFTRSTPLVRPYSEQSPSRRRELVVLSEPVETHSPVGQSPTKRATMDDQGEKKEEPSLTKTIKKYSHVEGSTPREKVRTLYAQLREKSAAVEALQNEPSATPSSVEDIEPAEPVSIPETVAPLSVRVDKDSHSGFEEPPPEPSLVDVDQQAHDVESFQTIQPSALTMEHTEPKAPGSLHLGPSEFAITLPMDSRVKDDYERVLHDNSHIVWGHLSDSQQELQQEQVALLQQMLERLSNAATHPDINVAQHMKSADANFEQEAAWADYSSAKFLLLSYLIKAAGSHDMHLVITVRGEKTRDVVERYLKGKGFSYIRSREEMGAGTNLEVAMAKEALSFGIQTAQADRIVQSYKPPSAVIALDSSLNTKSPSIEHMRTTFARNGNLLPVVRLMVANSSEHVELCFPGHSSRDDLAALLRYSIRLRDIVGDLQDDALGVQEDAGELMTCLLSDNFDAFWALPQVEPLRESSLTGPTEDENLTPPTVEPTKPATTVAQKRVFMEDSIEPTSKRPRTDESQETSQFTVSSKGATQTLDTELQNLEKGLLQMRNKQEAEIERLQKALVATQTFVQEREKALGLLQHRYESRTKELHKIRQERDRLLEAKTASDQKTEKHKEDMTKLRDERTQLRHELEAAREALKSGGGDAAELEKAREEIRRLTKENASLVRKSEYEHKQAEYTRDQYQTASNVAAQSATELRQLKEENETLNRKLAGEAARLRELNLKNDETQHLKRVAELESLLSSREDLLRRKEDELREIRKNRPSTRSTSTAPRSPKLNAGNSRPTSPGIMNNNNNNNGHNYPGRGSALRFSSDMHL
ncbi:class II histone deacetylase complex subunits 2 and 3-domain-containing protein [Aspergillus karnatakaensis]|uniref:uncharacterized protein n=1 Tax=Aspergillus karnatakaensis TaxID=1810916 RepID=UPI003CCCB2C8